MAGENTVTGMAASVAAGLRQTATLNGGVKMPWLGLGVWQIPDKDAERVVASALQLGYRGVDTARLYGNERGVGRAIAASGLRREDIFVTTKVWNDDIRANRVADAFERSRDALGLDYVDLYLVHWPITGKIATTWQAMEKLLAGGRVKAIGVSNHLRPHLDELLRVAQVVPAVNQLEFHPYLQSKPLVEFCRAQGIQPQAWSPLMQGGALLRDPVLADIARRHGKTIAQVVLRWDVQAGVATIPKSVRPERMKENATIFDFELSAEEVSAIGRLDRNHRSGADPANFSF